MDFRRLGRSKLEVSRICFGTWQFGGEWGAVEREEAKAAVRKALDLGVNFFDTAQAYGFGESEELLAEALGDDIRRDDVIVATKGGLRPTGDGGVERDSSPDWLRLGVDASLGHLGVEAVDLYQVHWPDPDTPFEETAGALAELKGEGKIRHVGVSNFSAEEMEGFEQILPVETLQPPYHLFRREIEEEVLPWCSEHNVGVLAYGPLAHGLLSGKIDSGWRPDEDDWRASSDLFQGDRLREALEKVEELKRFADERGWTVAQLAVAWTLANPAVHVAIVGARRPDHIDGTAPAAEIELSEADLGEIEEIMGRMAPVGGPTPEAA